MRPKILVRIYDRCGQNVSATFINQPNTLRKHGNLDNHDCHNGGKPYNPAGAAEQIQQIFEGAGFKRDDRSTGGRKDAQRARNL